jgi:hypothetical protein
MVQLDRLCEFLQLVQGLPAAPRKHSVVPGKSFPLQLDQSAQMRKRVPDTASLTSTFHCGTEALPDEARVGIRIAGRRRRSAAPSSPGARIYSCAWANPDQYRIMDARP